jgi:Glycosyl transferase family 2
MTGAPASGPQHARVASVIVPAHNEEQVVGRLLRDLLDESGASLEIWVVCNGCTDRTAEVARGFGSAVNVVEIDEASKRLALARGDAEATAFPRLFIDADVEITGRSVLHLVEELSSGDVEAVGPERIIPMVGVSPWVRWYYDVWRCLPQVRSGLFGRGVIAVTEAGNERIRALPPSMGDDLAASEAFAPHERRIIPSATVVVHPPRTVRDLYRRRVRAVTGNAQADATAVRGSASTTSPATLLGMVRERPSLALRLPVFVGFTIAARVAARRAIRAGDFDTWRRDDSSRQVS